MNFSCPLQSILLMGMPNQMWYYHLFFIWNILNSKTRFAHIESFTFHSTKGLPSFTSMKSSFAIVVKTPSRLEQNRNIIYYSFGTSSLNPSDLIITMWKDIARKTNMFINRIVKYSHCIIIETTWAVSLNRMVFWGQQNKKLQVAFNAYLIK